MLLRSSMLGMTTRNTIKIVKALRGNEKRRGWDNNENDLKLILEKDLTDEIHTYVKLQKDLRKTPEKLEESGKILGKDLWVRAHWKENIVEKGLLIRYLMHRNNWDIRMRWQPWINSNTDESPEMSSELRNGWMARGKQAWKILDLRKRI